ncbi:aldo/keto reductase [Candidatus Aalborgicola defluviihabitans]|mgnify:CR=1 FL=1|jgi:aryl-alcohol dehydrogenase-like predicted oxidoreductase|uniref:aldo/keto reductase n=1 Tax=Candidatus Aalborgicola defluviihabitans TaxID=3386187 RepID=UPI001DD3123E|nr:aldo/keto reductase [Burkholderiales bacterium]MBK7315343.1 aldo/keto reductase [Burkholderiales bacterium]
MQTRALGTFQVSAIGLGCMNLDHAYGPATSELDGERVLLGALDAGYTHLDTATLYGGGKNEERIGRVLARHRQRFVLASKCGMAIIPVEGKPTRVIDGRPETLRRECEASLRRLKTDVIDLYYLHRWDKKVPIEDSVGALSDLVRKGMIRGIGLSEVSAPTLRRAHEVHPIAALQTEYSLWSRNAEIAVLDACRELGVAFVAFSPLARAYLCGGLNDVGALDIKDIRRAMPRFGPGHYDANLQLLPAYRLLAQEAGCSPAQLALAWLLHKAPHAIPIPGTTNVAHLLENAAAADVDLNPDLIARLDALINQKTVSGPRYDVQATGEVDTEDF